MGRIALVIAALAGLSLPAGCAVEEIDGPTHEQEFMRGQFVVETNRRKGASQRFLVLAPESPAASVILFAGGSGRLDMGEVGSIRNLAGNFLVKTRHQFVRQGLVVAVVDAPSDRPSLARFRSSLAHAIDLKGVIAYLRDKWQRPVWLVGTSRGTISAASVAAHLQDSGPDGVVLTSSVTVAYSKPSVYAADLASIRVPVLVVHHEDDACQVTPYGTMPSLMNALENATPKELVTISGGIGQIGPACGPPGPHGFLAQEPEVVRIIADWIKAH